MNNGTKDWYASYTVWGGILAALAPVVGTILHQDIPSDLITQTATALATIGGIIAIIGRMRASTSIQGGPTKVQQAKTVAAADPAAKVGP